MAGGPYAAVGAKLVDRGYAAIPIMPGSKRPGQKRGGEWFGIMDWRDRWSLRLPTSFETQHWSATDAGVCVVAGPASKDLVAIDIDTERPDITKALHAILPPTTIRKAGAKGETLFYRGVIDPWNGTPCPSFNIDGTRVCDVIGPGRQTVLPPTIHPDTRQPYRWTGPDALQDVDPSDLPELPSDIGRQIAEALAPFGLEAVTTHAVNPIGGDTDSPHRLLNQTALERLDAWVPQLGLYRCKATQRGYEAVATWRPSSTGRQENIRKLNLKIDPGGIRDFGADKGYTPINLIIASQACDLDTAFKFLAGALGWSNEPIELTPTVAHPGDLEACKTLPAEVAVPKKKPDELAALTHVPGVVGDLIDWITATARRPNRVLALGAAVTIVGTLIGRRVAGPTRSATHLYVVTLAPTGSGKQHAIDCTDKLMTVAGAKSHLGPSQFFSMSAVINFMHRAPLSLCTLDEFGAFLKRINHRRASSHEMGISMILRSIWGANYTTVRTPEWAGKASEAFSSPALSIHGMSVQNEFYEALQGSDLSNGFLNRFLVFSSDVRAAEETPMLTPGEVPERLTAALDALYQWDGTQLGTARLSDPNLNPEPDILPWASDAAHEVYKTTMLEIERDSDKSPESALFLARTGEIALRLATIRAAGRWGNGAMVDVTDIEWGRNVARTSANLMIAGAAANMADNDYQANYKRVLRIINDAGTITKSALTRRLDGVLSAREYDGIVAQLIEGGRILEARSVNPKGGRPSITYSAQKN